MAEIVADDGCPAFAATVEFDDARAGQRFQWGVRHDGPSGANGWGISTEVPDPDSPQRYREFELPGPGPVHEERYHLTYSRRLGAQKFYTEGDPQPGLRFAVWAPNARQVEVVFGRRERGYIADDGTGIDPATPSIPLSRGAGGIWESAPVAGFDSFVGAPYMFRIETAQGGTVYRTDIHSKEDLFGERAGAGGTMFRFYQDLIRLRRANPAVRSRRIDVVHAHGPTRVIAFTRRDGQREVLVVASLNDRPFPDGYVVQSDPDRIPAGLWQETFNSAAAIYGGSNVGNFGAAIPASDGRLELRIPANGFLVLQKR